MPRTVARGSAMTQTMAIRVTENDKAEIKLAALKQGLDISQFMRQLLIREKIISPTGTSTAGW